MLPSPHTKAPPLECFSIVALREITLFAAGSLLGFATTSYSLIVFLLNPYFPYNYRFFLLKIPNNPATPANPEIIAAACLLGL